MDREALVKQGANSQKQKRRKKGCNAHSVHLGAISARKMVNKKRKKKKPSALCKLKGKKSILRYKWRMKDEKFPGGEMV